MRDGVSLNDSLVCNTQLHPYLFDSLSANVGPLTLQGLEIGAIVHEEFDVSAPAAVDMSRVGTCAELAQNLEFLHCLLQSHDHVTFS